MGRGDISHEKYEDICELCRIYSWVISRNSNSVQDTFTRNSRLTSTRLTQVELGNLLDDFKTNILGSLASQIDTIQLKQKQANQEKELAFFCSKCKQNQPLIECPLNSI